MYDVVAMGELLIDFIQNGVSVQRNPLFEANPGGAPCNVLAMLQKLGHKTSFIGKVGDDFFGRFLGETISNCGIGTEGLVYASDAKTTLALVHNREDGDREFSFYRKPGADMMLRSDEVSEALIQDCCIFHFGTVSMTDEPVKSATITALDYAKKAGKLISFDPNLRLPLWTEPEAAREAIWCGIKQCDILKIADNELQWLTKEDSFDRGVQKIHQVSSAKMINVTLGKEGSLSYYEGSKIFAEPFLSSGTVDTTGAGDTFCACVLSYVLKHGLSGLSRDDIREMLLTANAAASIITTRKGAICSMPEPEEVKALL